MIFFETIRPIDIFILIATFILTLLILSRIKQRKKRLKEYEALKKRGYEELNKSDHIKKDRARLNKLDKALKQFQKAFEISPKKEMREKIAECERRKKNLASKLKKSF